MRKAIAIDFDGCLCTDAFPAIGEPNWPVIKRAQAEQRAGAGLILWTCREGQILQDAISACESWGLTFDAVNESLPDWIETYGNRPRKVGATEHWDDKAVRIPDTPLPNDPLTLEELREMDGEPVWVDRPGYGKNWALVNVWAKSTNIIYLTCNNGMVLHPQPELDSGAKIYRRRPEGG